jgi:hypothetical protein
VSIEIDDSAAEPRFGRIRRPWRWAVALVVLVGVVLVAIDLTLAGDVLLVTVDRPGEEAPRASLSDEQQSLLDELGNPDGFTIFFVDDGSESVRMETWSYYQAGREVSFVDGELSADESPEPAVVTRPTPFTPDLFTPFADLQQIVTATGVVEYLEYHVEDELLAGGTVHVAEQLMLGLKDGRLLYVEAVPLAEGG